MEFTNSYVIGLLKKYCNIVILAVGLPVPRK